MNVIVMTAALMAATTSWTRSGANYVEEGWNEVRQVRTRTPIEEPHAG
tara:strand:- start:109 stop:252 length:144 start_codon:yes stop_codon:yes gene_type:complete